MAQIKQTIELLTKILKYNGTSKIKPEYFRQAKFDRDDATESMWRLLFEILYYLRYNKIDDVTVKAYSELSREELCVFVKTEMKLRGFYSRSFHELPANFVSGSRELLLAFGWLMCRCQLINTFMNNCCSSLQLHQTNLPIEKDSTLSDRKLAPPCLDSINDKVKYLMWLNGKLRMNLRNLYSLQQQKTSLTTAISKATLGVTTNPELRNSLTPLEVMMVQNPQLLKKNLKLLDSDNERLEALLSWSSHDDLFWKWMESVLDAKVASSGLIEEVSDRITPRTSAVKQRVDGRLEIAETVGNYEAVVQHIERDLMEQADSHSVEELDVLLSRLDAEILRHRLRLCPTASSDTALPSEPPVARIKPVARLGEPRDETTASEAEVEIVKIEGELNELQELVERLQTDIQFKHKNHRDDIATSSSAGVEYVSRGSTIFTSSCR